VELQVAQSFETSKKNLQTDYVDCLILHSPMPTLELLMKAWGAMEQIQRSGGVCQLGVSNCYDARIFRTLHTQAHIKPAIVQDRFYEDTGYDSELRRWCSKNGVPYQSFWTLTANPHLLASNAVATLAAKHGRTAAQIFFRHLTQSGIVPLTGTASEQHMREDLVILDFELASDELTTFHPGTIGR
jgi:diketogulonate reductase-like aldo/keto reductase